MKIKRNFKGILLFALMFLLPTIPINTEAIRYNTYNIINKTINDSIKINVNNIQKITLDEQLKNEKDSLKQLLIEETNKYIQKYRKNCPITIPENIVHYGLEHNIDICFMLSQTKTETCFGKTGIGREQSKHSLFGVMKRTYRNYELAIKDYVSILKTSYLVKGRDEQYLLRNYVNKGGYRYAGNKNYEAELRKTYNEICKLTNIKSLQIKYKNK